jgi:2-keto-4-pentenoate hydratase
MNAPLTPQASREPDSTAEALAAALTQARAFRTPTDATPFAQTLTRPEQAYAVQRAMAATQGWFKGGVPTAWKSGGPSRTAALTHAPLPDAGVWHSPANAAAHQWHFNRHGVEAEIALRLNRPVDAALAAALTPESAEGLIDAMAVSIELVDTRLQQSFDAPPLVKLADLQAHSALILSAWQPYRRVDWAAQPCRVKIGAQPEVRHTGTHSMGDPAWLLPLWLRHATAEFGTVPAGTVVTTGTWVGILMAQAGDRVQVAFDGIAEASVQL